MVKRSWSIASLTRGFFSPEFSRTEGLPAGTEGSSAFLRGSGPWVRGEPCRVLLFGWGLEELPGAGCVADGGAGSRPKVAARCRGSAPVAMASSSWRSTRSVSTVAAWPRRAELTQVLLAGPVRRAVWALMSRCGLAVPGHLARRVSSQVRSRRAVRSSRGRGRPPRSSRPLPGSASARRRAQMVLLRAAWTPARATMSRAAGVTAAATASSMSSWPSGCSTVADGRRPTLMPRAGLRKITPADRQNPNSERRATRGVMAL